MKNIIKIIFIFLLILPACGKLQKDLPGIYVNPNFEVLEIYKENDSLSVEIHDWENFKGIIEYSLFGLKNIYFKRNTYVVSIKTENKNNQKYLYVNYQCRGCEKNTNYYAYTKIAEKLSEGERKELLKKCSILRRVPLGNFLSNDLSHIYNIKQSYPDVQIIKYSMDNFYIKNIEESKLKIDNNIMTVSFNNKKYQLNEYERNGNNSWYIGNEQLCGEYRQVYYITFEIGENFAPVRYKYRNREITENKKASIEDIDAFKNSELLISKVGIFIITKQKNICLPVTIDGEGYSEFMTIKDYAIDRDKYFYNKNIFYQHDISVDYGFSNYDISHEKYILLKDYSILINYTKSM